MSGAASYHHPLSVDATAAGVSPTIDTVFARSCRVDIHLEAFTGGTTPSITWILETLNNPGGRWYQVWSSGAVTAAPSDISVDIGEAMSATYVAGTTTMAHAMLGRDTRLRWVFGGGVAPTSVTFSATVYPRP